MLNKYIMTIYIYNKTNLEFVNVGGFIYKHG